MDSQYRPRRIHLATALGHAGLTPDHVQLIVNCHLHFDHCGGNPLLPGRPVIVQHRELEAARGHSYTLPELIDAPGIKYDKITGEAEPLPGVVIIPTPGHTAGHQSVVIRQPDERSSCSPVRAMTRPRPIARTCSP
jgi:N-acyl homoserine lactone hydrolase